MKKMFEWILNFLRQQNYRPGDPLKDHPDAKTRAFVARRRRRRA